MLLSRLFQTSLRISSRCQFNMSSFHLLKSSQRCLVSASSEGSTHRYFSSHSWKLFCKLGVAAFAVGSSAIAYSEASSSAPDTCTAGIRREGLPTFKRDEIAKHKTKEQRIWVTFRDGVYDITDFVDIHPGGERILMAVGSAIDPYWALYAAHYVQSTYEILETYRIGNIDPAERISQKELDANDPYRSEPERFPGLEVRNAKPFNAEAPSDLLSRDSITPNALHFVRNHLPVPVINPETYSLEIHGEGIKAPLVVTLKDLETGFNGKLPRVTVEVTLQCAGNRRAGMSKVKETKGLQWDRSSISNATWTGVRLRDVLIMMGYNVDADPAIGNHVVMEGYDKDSSQSYGASFPIEKALDPRGDVIIATHMNGVPIPRDHGYPARVIVPGYVGARNVKWVKSIVISSEESKSFWQTNDYKGFSPSQDFDKVDYSSAWAIQELPVQSTILVPRPGQSVECSSDYTIPVTGYAWSGGGHGIERVDVSADGGETWVTAKLVRKQNNSYVEVNKNEIKRNRQWGWQLWEADVPVSKSNLPNKVEIICKATDSSYNVQPESMKGVWNLRGVLGNAWDTVPIIVTNE